MEENDFGIRAGADKNGTYSLKFNINSLQYEISKALLMNRMLRVSFFIWLLNLQISHLNLFNPLIKDSFYQRCTSLIELFSNYFQLFSNNRVIIWWLLNQRCTSLGIIITIWFHPLRGCLTLSLYKLSNLLIKAIQPYSVIIKWRTSSPLFALRVSFPEFPNSV